MLLHSLQEVFQTDCRLDLERPLVLGFSGGPDSLVLLHLLRDAGFSPLVAHLDHGLRPESAEDRVRAGQMTAALDLEFFAERVDAGAYANSHHLSVEEAGRELRYRFLFRLAEEKGVQAVAVAHNADDQVETVLMHLLRGAGPDGMRGMAPRLLPNPWSATIPLVRPLLGIWRSEILEYCAEQELAPIYDASNESLTFFRNRLRNQLLPKLEEFSPGLKTRLHHSAELLQADYAVLENLAEEAWLRCLAQRGEQFLAIDRRAFLEEPLALRRSILRRAAAELRPVHRDVGFDDIERALSYLGDPTPSAKDWLAGLYILAEENLVWIADWQAALPVAWPQAPIHEQHVEVPTNIELNHGWHLQLNESRSAAPPAETNNDPYQAWLDLDMTGDELILRRRKPGDRFQPLGMESGSLKLADFMINEKMPARARAGWPLLCKGEEIVWVPGYRMAHAVRLRPESHRALHVQVAK